MTKTSWVLSISFFLCVGCSMPNQSLSTLASSELNIQRMSRVAIGMSQKEVFSIMRAPFRYETFSIDTDSYDVWFYITMPTVLAQSRMVPQNLTPLAFKNGVLIGFGYRFYNYFLQTNSLEKKPLDESAPSFKPPTENQVDFTEADWDVSDADEDAQMTNDDSDGYQSDENLDFAERYGDSDLEQSDQDLDAELENPQAEQNPLPVDNLKAAKTNKDDQYDSKDSKKKTDQKKKSDKPPPAEEPPPNKEGREMLEDDAEDDFNTW